MNQTGKDQLFLELVADLTRFYTLLSQALRPAAGEAALEEMTPEQLRDQIGRLWSSLKPRLEANSIVKSKLEKEYLDAMRMASEHPSIGPKDEIRTVLEREAIRMMTDCRLKAAAFSDLVALYRRM